MKFLKKKIELFKSGFSCLRFVAFLHGNMFCVNPARTFRVMDMEANCQKHYFIPLEEAETVYTNAFWEVLTTDLKDT